MWKFLGNLLKLNAAIADQTKAIMKYDEGLAFVKAKDFVRALPLIAEAAELGNTDAMAFLGAEYLTGTNTKADGKAAERYLRAAVAGGHQDAKGLLGMGYATGKAGFPKDLDTGIFYLKEAAQEGDEKAAAMLVMIDKGEGIFAKRKR
ncbi:MAG: hypothetical protein L6Q60_04525 [Rhodocyclaceae bacterium]|nr:hypothetical protein [Rhodocyclaceae bacterium]